jgi:hypothetical protein
MIGMLPGFDCHCRLPHSDVAAFRLPVARRPKTAKRSVFLFKVAAPSQHAHLKNQPSHHQASPRQPFVSHPRGLSHYCAPKGPLPKCTVPRTEHRRGPSRMALRYGGRSLNFKEG